MTTKRKVILSILGVIVVLYLLIYTVLTPFIRGVVVDETTGQPVENAWVMATAGVSTRTIAGDMGGDFVISRPHLKTDKNGAFNIFPKLYPSIPTPFTFGNMKKNLNIVVRAKDGKRAEVNLTEQWWKRFFFAVIPVKFVDRKEDDIYRELATLTGYCIAGGFGFLQMNRSEKCDSWELEYTIAEQEKFLEIVSLLSAIDQRVYYASTLFNLALLYKGKGELAKALGLVKRVRDYDLERGLSWNTREYNNQIVEIESKLKQ